MRILGIGLLVALFASAFGANSALAAKDPYNANTWGQYKNCPYEDPEITDCVYGRTAGGKEGGEFKFGHVRVLLNKPIVIQLGFKGAGEAIEVSPPTSGELIEAPEMPIVGGLNTITAKVQEQAEWPAALKESFKAAKKAKETKALVKIEPAGDECITVPGCISTENLIEEKGEAFHLALKVRVNSPWLEKLGGGPCLIGSDENPVHQNLTSSGAGRAGQFIANESFNQFEFHNSLLVDTSWTIDPASGPKGCGGEYESYVDDALERVLEMKNFPQKSGITWLTGDLHDGGREAVHNEHENGNPELP
jgi:hypothetical protein